MWGTFSSTVVLYCGSVGNSFSEISATVAAGVVVVALLPVLPGR